MTDALLLSRRLERHRAWQRRAQQPDEDDRAPDPRRATALAVRIADAVDGEVVATDQGTYVRRDGAAVAVPIDRDALAGLPDQPAAGTPLLFLDTETTGLGTATGTYAFLIGLARWEDDRLIPIQLLLPDQSEERAFLAAVADLVPADGWLVTYNGRGFDWPLLVTRFRMGHGPPPVHAGHLDLLPIVRRLFRHRMTDARLATVETELLSVHRGGDVGGWEIPGRYLSFLRDGSPHHLVDVVRHNAIDVTSLARLLGHIAARLGDRDRWTDAEAGDLAGLSRLFRRHHRDDDALACLEAALVASGRPSRRPATSHASEAWWSPRARPDYGGRPGPPRSAWPPGAAFDAGWSEARLLVERARLLRRVDRIDDALAAWEAVAAVGGPMGAAALIEVAKLREHARHDYRGALEAALRGRATLDRCRSTGRPAAHLERDIGHRIGRLRRRLAAVRGAA
ncbi:MAG TPA: ribonuclease H-like domain-containing protein [Candidatus Limnocylindrales bacterium]|nr:ribonuclease H-like domain-containing protein [Candidatus Limnocylindrales bacterium]